MTKKIIILIIFGLVLRIGLMFFTLHPDIRGHNLAAYFISQKNLGLSFYDYLSNLPRDHWWVSLYGDGLFIYPPLAYWTLAAFMKLLSPVYPWQTFLLLIDDIGKLKLDPLWMWLMFLLKFPYLVIDLAGFWWLIRRVKDKLSFTVLWAFSLPVLFSAYMMGQFDIAVGVLILISALVSTKKFHFVSAIILGVAAGFKPFPLFLLPFLGQSFKEKFISVIAGLATYGLIIGPYLGSVGFKNYALMASQTDKLVFAKIMVSGSQYLPIFWLGMAMLWWWNWFRPRQMAVWGWFTAGLLLFFSVTHFHPQWFTWVSLLLIWSWIYKSKTRLPIVILSCSFTLLLLLFEPSLNFGLFGIDFNLFDWINKRFPADQLASMIRAVLAATSVITVINLSSDNDNLSSNSSL